MGERWIDGAIHNPGANAGGSITSMQFCVMHFTAGVDSRQIGKNGYFNLLCPKEGVAIQYAGLDELTWNSGPWNPYGPGIEFERMNADEPLTPDQEFWGGVAAVILNRDYGIPLEHYQGPRYQGGNFRGFINHSDLDPQRSDGVTQDEFEKMFDHNAAEAKRHRGEDMILHDIEHDQWYWVSPGGPVTIDKSMAYAMAVGGAIVVDNLPALAIIGLGIYTAQAMQRNMAFKF